MKEVSLSWECTIVNRFYCYCCCCCQWFLFTNINNNNLSSIYSWFVFFCVMSIIQKKKKWQNVIITDRTTAKKKFLISYLTNRTTTTTRYNFFSTFLGTFSPGSRVFFFVSAFIFFLIQFLLVRSFLIIPNDIYLRLGQTFLLFASYFVVCISSSLLLLL